MTLKTALLSLQALLSSPQPDDPQASWRSLHGGCGTGMPVACGVGRGAADEVQGRRRCTPTDACTPLLLLGPGAGGLMGVAAQARPPCILCWVPRSPAFCIRTRWWRGSF